MMKGESDKLMSARSLNYCGIRRITGRYKSIDLVKTVMDSDFCPPKQ